MFEPTERIAAMVDQLYALFETRDRGDIVSHTEIGAVLGTDPHQDHYQWCLRQMERRLQDERGIAIWNERTVGYKLLTKEEQIHVPFRKRTQKARGEIRKTQRAIECLPADGLSDHQRFVLSRRIEQCQQMEQDLRQQLRDREWMIQPTQVNPVRPR